MSIKYIVEQHQGDLPGYELVAYIEAGLPLYKQKIYSLIIKKERLPVVQEFILNLLDNDIAYSDISYLLGLDSELVENEIGKLVSDGHIEYKMQYNNYYIKSKGRHYLAENQIEKLDKIENIIYIDGITRKILNSNVKFMSAKNLRENGIKALRCTKGAPQLEEIEFKSLKKEVLRQNEEKDSFGKIDIAEVVDIVDIINKSTEYLRVNILLFANHDDEYRMLVYEGNTKKDIYEKELFNMEQNGFPVFEYNLNNYFSSKYVQLLNDYVNIKSLNKINLSNTNEYVENMVKLTKNEITIITSFNKLTQLEDFLISDIQNEIEKSNKPINVKLILSVAESNDKKIIDRCYSLKSLLESTKMKGKLSIINVPIYYPEMIIVDNEIGVLVNLEKKKIYLESSKECVIDCYYKLNEENIKEIESKIDINKEIEITKNIKIIADKISKVKVEELYKQMNRMLVPVDQIITTYNQIGWFGEKTIPTLKNSNNVAVCRNKTMFKQFIDELNQELVETIDRNSGNKNYFWKEFKENFPVLQLILSKIRVYRNKEFHDKLNSTVEEKYIVFLNEDIQGRIPELTPGSYEVLQYNILKQLNESMVKIIE